MFDNLFDIFDISSIRNRAANNKRERKREEEFKELKGKYLNSPFFAELMKFVRKKDSTYVVISIVVNSSSISVQWFKLDSNGFIERQDPKDSDLCETLKFADIGYDLIPDYKHQHSLSLAFQEQLGNNYRAHSDDIGDYYNRVYLKNLPPQKPTGLKPTL